MAKGRDLGIAPIYLGRKGSLICSACDKASFATEEDAQAAADNASSEMYCYLGDECRWWHLTRSPPREEG